MEIAERITLKANYFGFGPFYVSKNFTQPNDSSNVNIKVKVGENQKLTDLSLGILLNLRNSESRELTLINTSGKMYNVLTFLPLDEFQEIHPHFKSQDSIKKVKKLIEQSKSEGCLAIFRKKNGKIEEVYLPDPKNQKILSTTHIDLLGLAVLDKQGECWILKHNKRYYPNDFKILKLDTQNITLIEKTTFDQYVKEISGIQKKRPKSQEISSIQLQWIEGNKKPKLK